MFTLTDLLPLIKKPIIRFATAFYKSNISLKWASLMFSSITFDNFSNFSIGNRVARYFFSYTFHYKLFIFGLDSYFLQRLRQINPSLI